MNTRNSIVTLILHQERRNCRRHASLIFCSDMTRPSQIFIALMLNFGAIPAYDPIEGIPFSPNCTKCRRNSGCNETLLEVYKKTEESKTDSNINEADTKVYLYTCANQTEPECLHQCGGRLPSDTRFRPESETVMIIGGHISSVCLSAYFLEMKYQLLCRGPYNVIIADWYWGNGADVYGVGANTKVLCKQMALVIGNIMDQTGVTGDKFHIIAHAQGAHAAGCIGQRLKSQGREIRRITGLSPTGIQFLNASNNETLDSSDAKCVDIMHTGKGLCFPVDIETTADSGDANFQVNGGSVQPYCVPYSSIISLLKLDYPRGLQTIYPAVCYIYRSIDLMIESINPCDCRFIGVKCKDYESFQSGKCRECGEDGSNCAVMGMDWEFFPHSATEKSSYYLNTNPTCPFCNNDGIKLQGFPSNATKGHCFDPKNCTMC